MTTFSIKTLCLQTKPYIPDIVAGVIAVTASVALISIFLSGIPFYQAALLSGSAALVGVGIQRAHALFSKQKEGNQDVKVFILNYMHISEGSTLFRSNIRITREEGKFENSILQIHLETNSEPRKNIVWEAISSVPGEYSFKTSGEKCAEHKHLQDMLARLSEGFLKSAHQPHLWHYVRPHSIS